MDTKELKKLAAACRAAGIKHYKNGAIEFTLSDEAPTSTKRKKPSGEPINVSNDELKVESEAALSEEALLFWSVGDVEGANQ